MTHKLPPINFDGLLKTKVSPITIMQNKDIMGEVQYIRDNIKANGIIMIDKSRHDILNFCIAIEFCYNHNLIELPEKLWIVDSSNNAVTSLITYTEFRDNFCNSQLPDPVVVIPTEPATETSKIVQQLKLIRKIIIACTIAIIITLILI